MQLAFYDISLSGALPAWEPGPGFSALLHTTCSFKWVIHPRVHFHLLDEGNWIYQCICSRLKLSNLMGRWLRILCAENAETASEPGKSCDFLVMSMDPWAQNRVEDGASWQTTAVRWRISRSLARWNFSTAELSEMRSGNNKSEVANWEVVGFSAETQGGMNQFY